MYSKQRGNADVIGMMFSLMFLAAWITAILNCIARDRWGMLLIDFFLAPIGVLHGIGIWFGWF